MSIVKVEPSVWSHLDGHRHRELRVESDADGYVVTLRGRQTKVKIEDPRAWGGAGAGKAGSGVAKVATPMPGKVIRVLVAIGDRVESGLGLVVVEAMKMQNELKSPIAGIVKQVQAVEGATVNANQVLVVVESDAS
jgi:biotin carboxyl carrier protein